MPIFTKGLIPTSLFSILFRSRDKPTNRTADSAYSFFLGAVSDSDAYGSERVVLFGCLFGDLTLMSFKVGKVMEEEFSGGFTDFSFPDIVKPR